MKKYFTLLVALVACTALSTGCDDKDSDETKECDFEEWSIKLSGSDRESIFFCSEDGQRVACDQYNKIHNRPCNEDEVCTMTASGNAICIVDKVGKECSENEKICNGDRVLGCVGGEFDVVEDCLLGNMACRNGKCVDACSYKEARERTNTGTQVVKMCGFEHFGYGDVSWVGAYICMEGNDAGYSYELTEHLQECAENEWCQDAECKELEACTHSRCDGNVLETCDRGYYRYKVDCSEDSDICLTDDDGEASCFAECPAGKDFVSSCDEDGYLTTYACKDVGSKHVYYGVDDEQYCENGCENDQCVKISDYEGKSCSVEGATMCDGDVILSCDGETWYYDYTCWEGSQCMEKPSEEHRGTSEFGCYEHLDETCSDFGDTRTECSTISVDICTYDIIMETEKCYLDSSYEEPDPSVWYTEEYPALALDICMKDAEGHLFWTHEDREECERSCTRGSCDNHSWIGEECNYVTDSNICDENIVIYCDHDSDVYKFEHCKKDTVCGTYPSKYGGVRQTDADCFETCNTLGEKRDFVCREDAITLEDDFPVRSYREVCTHFDSQNFNGWLQEVERCYHGCNENTGKCDTIHSEEGKSCDESGSFACDAEKNIALICTTDGFVRAEQCTGTTQCTVSGSYTGYCVEP